MKRRGLMMANQQPVLISVKAAKGLSPVFREMAALVSVATYCLAYRISSVA